MDRGAEAKATLSTYTWTQFESFAKELSLPASQAPLATKPLAAEEAHAQYGRHISGRVTLEAVCNAAWPAGILT